MSILLFHFIRAYPSPSLCPQVQSLHLHLYSCPIHRFIKTIFFLFHIYVLAYSICFSLSYLLHTVWQTLSPSTLLQKTQFRFFSWLSNIPLYICAKSSLSIHLLMDNVLAIVNSAAMNTVVHDSFELQFSQGICPRVGLLGHMVVLFLVF